MPGIDGYEALNNSGEEIPSYSAVEVTGVSGTGGYELYAVEKPSEDNIAPGKIMFTGAGKIPINKHGRVFSAYDSRAVANGTASDDGYCGVASGSFVLSADKTGFISQGSEGGKLWVRPFSSGIPTPYFIYDTNVSAIVSGVNEYESSIYEIKNDLNEPSSFNISRSNTYHMSVYPFNMYAQNKSATIGHNITILQGGLYLFDDSLNKVAYMPFGSIYALGSKYIQYDISDGIEIGANIVDLSSYVSANIRYISLYARFSGNDQSDDVQVSLGSSYLLLRVYRIL